MTKKSKYKFYIGGRNNTDFDSLCYLYQLRQLYPNDKNKILVNSESHKLKLLEYAKKINFSLTADEVAVMGYEEIYQKLNKTVESTRLQVELISSKSRNATAYEIDKANAVVNGMK